MGTDEALIRRSYRRRISGPLSAIGAGIVGLFILVYVIIPRVLTADIVFYGVFSFSNARDYQVFSKAMPVRASVDGLRCLNYAAVDETGPSPAATVAFLAPYDYTWPPEYANNSVLLRRLRIVAMFTLLLFYCFLAILMPVAWLLDALDSLRSRTARIYLSQSTVGSGCPTSR